MADAHQELLTDLLKEVSRSFYLTLRILPRSVRDQIGLAYLLARTTDTIADTEIVPVQRRLDMLEKLRERILGRSASKLEFSELAANQGSSAERLLLEKTEASLSLLADCSPTDQQFIREALDTITSGQALDLQRFSNASASQMVALRTNEELDDYTYRVAGCVGEFWTKICVRNQFHGSAFLKARSSDEAEFLSLGIRFGKGLQLVNILRDLPVDLRNGRCYVPAESLARAGLNPADLLQPENYTRFKPLYEELLNSAEAHLKAGWKYTNLIPRGEMRIRLACAWPILIGVKTIKLLRAGNVLDAARRIKVGRAEVKRLMLQSIVRYPFRSWSQLPEQI